MTKSMPVTVTSSTPYVKIAGGYTSARPVGLRRTYTAEVDGRKFENESKATIMSVIRAYVRRIHDQGVTFTFETLEEK